MAEGKKISELPYISGGMDGAVNRKAMFPLEVEGSNAKLDAQDISSYISRLASRAGAANFQTMQISNRISSLLNIGDSFIQFSSDFGVSDDMPLGTLLLDTETKMLCVAIEHPSSNPSQFRWLVIAKDCKCGGENASGGGGIKPIGIIRACAGEVPDFEWHYISDDFGELDDLEGSPPKVAFEATKYIGDDVVKQEYTPKDFDIWFNWFNNTYWIWQRDEWQPFDFVKYNRKIKIFNVADGSSLSSQLGSQKTLQFSELSNSAFHSVSGLSTDGITSRPEIGSYILDQQQQKFGVIKQVFESSVDAVTLGSLGGGGNASLTISLNGQTNFAGNPYNPSENQSQEIALTINPFDFNPGQNSGGIVDLYAASQSGFALNSSIGANGFTDPAGKNCYKDGGNVFYNWEDIVDPLTLAFYINNSTSGQSIHIYNVPTNEKRIFYFYGDNAETQITFKSLSQPLTYGGQVSFQAGQNCMAIGFLVNSIFKASQFYNLSGGQI